MAGAVCVNSNDELSYAVCTNAVDDAPFCEQALKLRGGFRSIRPIQQRANRVHKAHVETRRYIDVYLPPGSSVIRDTSSGPGPGSWRPDGGVGASAGVTHWGWTHKDSHARI